MTALAIFVLSVISLTAVKSETVTGNWLLNSFAGGNDDVWVEVHLLCIYLEHSS